MSRVRLTAYYLIDNFWRVKYNAKHASAEIL